MLSIVPLKDVQAAKSYYEKDNYYIPGSKEAIEASHWYGNGAETLGLSGYVERDDFEQLLEGKLPNGIQLGRIENDQIVHRPGYDLTFSAPKSFSILCEVGRDKRLLQAHDKAVKAALEYVRQHAMQTRVFKNNDIAFEKVDNLTAALFRHDTSRELDPQTHTHAVLINAVLCKDGQWRSISSESIFEMKMATGIVYRAALAEFAKELGYEVDVTSADGLFEIKGVPEEVMEAFSKRREQIEKQMEEKGWEGSKAAEKVAQSSRHNKKEVDRSELYQQWKDESVALGFDPKTVIKKAKSRKPLTLTQDRKRAKIARQSVTYAVRHLSELESVFADHEVIREALAHGMGKIVLSDVKAAISDAFKKEQLLKIDDERWATKASKALEKNNIAQMEAGKNTVRAITDGESVSAYVYASDKRYTPGQIEAMNLILTTEDRFIGVQGDAGTGKTTMLNAVKDIAEEAGFSLLGMSPTKDAALQVEEKGGIDSITVKRFIQESQYKKPKSYDPTAPLLLVMDESSMLGSREMNDLLAAAKTQNLRMVFVGDVKQLSSPSAGKPFYILQRFGMSTAIMRDNVRQKAGSQIRQAVDHTIQGNFTEALRYVQLRERDHKEERLQQVANEYLDFSVEGRKNTLVLVPANKDRLVVNQLIRDGLKLQGELTGDEHNTEVLVARNFTKERQLFAMNYVKGNILEFHREYKSLNIAHGEQLKVIGIKKEKNTLIVEKKDGKPFELKLDRVRRFKSNAFSVYQLEGRQLMVGDKIRWRKNESFNLYGRDKNNRPKKIDLVNGHTANIIAIDSNSATVELQNGAHFRLALDQTGFQHWDYAFAHTVHAGQGKDKPNIVAHMESYRPKLTHSSALYTIISRGEFNVTLVVDDREQCIKTVEKHTGQKLSVLEELGELPRWKTKVQQAQIQINKQSQKLYAQMKQSGLSSTVVNKVLSPASRPKLWDIERLQVGLAKSADRLARHLLGDPNVHLSNSQRLRYGRKGSLSITITGTYAGTWKNFETDESGNMIQLIESQGYSFKGALDYAGSFLGLSPESEASIHTTKNSQPRMTVDKGPEEPNAEDLKAIARAEKVAAQTLPIEGTLAERYLREHRGITAPLKDDYNSYRFHPALYEPESKRKLPALVALATIPNGELHAVQMTYLDPITAKKANVSVNKRTLGRLRFGAAVWAGNKSSIVAYPGEGGETSLSVLSARPEGKVAATLSVSNLSKIKLDEITKEVVLCRDNDGEQSMSEKAIIKAKQRFIAHNYRLQEAIPRLTDPQAKVDYNDLLISGGVVLVSKSLDDAAEIEIAVQNGKSLLGLSQQEKKREIGFHINI